MGNDFAKAHGINPGQAITKAQFDQIWATVDTEHVGYIGRTEAEKFLKLFAEATEARWSAAKGNRILNDVADEKGNVTKNLFHRLFFTAAQELKVGLSESLAFELETETPEPPSYHTPHLEHIRAGCVMPILNAVQGKARPFRLSELVEPAAPAAPAPPPPKMEEANAKLLVTFREVVDARYEADLVGGKGLKLSQVAKSLGDDRSLFDVPPGAVLTTKAYMQHVQMLEQDDVLTVWKGKGKDLLAPIKVMIEELPLAPAAEAEIAALLKTFPPGATLAVRSSATIEDAGDFSMAGLCETYLHVPAQLDAVCTHVKRCWSSLWHERVTTYVARTQRDKNGGTVVIPKMAVVIQQMVDAKAAGVLFTLPPTTGEDDKMVIEVVWGLGEGLVSGEINPFSYTATWRDCAYTVRKVTQTKKYARTGNGAGVVETTPEERAHEPLNAALVKALVRMGVQVASFYGNPQDIEWAIDASGTVYMTQTRPITKYTLHLQLPRDTTWCGGFQSKSWLALSTSSVVGWSTFIMDMADFQAPSRFKSYDQIVRPFYGEPFSESTAHNAAMRGQQSGLLAKVLPTYWKQTLLFAQHYERDIQPKLWKIRTALPQLTDAELGALLVGLLDELKESDYHSFMCGSVAGNYLRQVEGDIKGFSRYRVDFTAGDMISGVHPINGAAARDIKEIAYSVRSHDGARKLVLNTPARELLQQLERDPEMEWLYADIKTYFEKFFWMCDCDEEINSVHWLDNPTFPIEILKREVAKAQFEPPVPPTKFDPQFTRIVDDLRKKGVPDTGLVTFVNDVTLLRHWLHAKEEIHMTYARINYFAQKAILELGRRWTAAGALASPQDFFWLGESEVRAVVARPATLHAVVPAAVYGHRTMKTMFKNFALPTLISGEQKALRNGLTSSEAADMPGDDDEALVGIGGAGGKVTARARVILSLDDAHLVQPGEILVTKMTSPGWTPLFSIIAGLVTEEGGVLSHAAVVARECKIPAVLQVEAATERIKTGDWLIVDGFGALVMRIPEP